MMLALALATALAVPPAASVPAEAALPPGNGIDSAWVDRLEPVHLLVIVDAMPADQLAAFEASSKTSATAIGGGVVVGSAMAMGQLSMLGFSAALPGIAFGVAAYKALADAATQVDVDRARDLSVASRTMMQQVDAAEDWDAQLLLGLERELGALGWCKPLRSTLISRTQVEAELARRGKRPQKLTVNKQMRARSEAAIEAALATPDEALLVLRLQLGTPVSLSGNYRTASLALYSHDLAALAYQLKHKGKWADLSVEWSEVPIYRADYASVTTPVDLRVLQKWPAAFQRELHLRADADAQREAAEVRANRAPRIAAVRLAELEMRRIREHYLIDDPDEWDVDRTADYMDEQWKAEDPAFYRGLMAADIEALVRRIGADLGRLEPANSVAPKRPPR